MARRGFTLIETLTVLTLLMLLIGVGQGFSVNYLRTQQLRAAADVVAAEMRVAQTDARTQVDDAAHGIKIFDDSVVRFEGSSYAGRTTSKDVRTDFATDLDASGTDEFVFPAAEISPTVAATATLSRGTSAIDIAISSYGLITITERTLGS